MKLLVPFSQWWSTSGFISLQDATNSDSGPASTTGDTSWWCSRFYFSKLILQSVNSTHIWWFWLVICLILLPSFAAFKINGLDVTLQIYFQFSLTLVNLNSSLNPAIYCCKMRHIRHTVMNIQRNMYWRRNSASSAGHTLSWISVNVPVKRMYVTTTF